MVVMRRAPREHLGSEVLVLDADQERVLGARAPVVRVLGAPGTGKSTVAVEVVADRVGAGLAADACLILAPTRLAATRLREAVTTRLGGTSTDPLARTPAAFAFALLRQQAALVGAPPPRLLSGPEQDVVLKELLDGHRADAEAGALPGSLGGGPPGWPDRVRPALPTRGFRHELRDLLMRAVEHGLDAAGLAQLGRDHERPEWVAAARVLDEYDQVTALSRPGAFDPAWIISAAADLLEDDPAALTRVRAAVRFVVVDDAQELTRPALRLLRLLADDQAQVVLLADPDSAVQTFRGADPRPRLESVARRSHDRPRHGIPHPRGRARGGDPGGRPDRSARQGGPPRSGGRSCRGVGRGGPGAFEHPGGDAVSGGAAPRASAGRYAVARDGGHRARQCPGGHDPTGPSDSRSAGELRDRGRAGAR